MNNEWKKLESWLQDHAPDSLADLNPPASDADIQTLETTLGVRLPLAFIHALKIHNGQQGRADGIFSGLEFLSTKRIITEWTVWQQLLDAGDFNDADANADPGIMNTWWSPAWIPFTYNGAGDHLCLDTHPSDSGRSGQIIAVWHDDGRRSLKASSFEQWFTSFIQTLS